MNITFELDLEEVVTKQFKKMDKNTLAEKTARIKTFFCDI